MAIGPTSCILLSIFPMRQSDGGRDERGAGAIPKPAGERGNLRIAVNELCKPCDIDVRPLHHGLAGKPGFIYFASLARASSTSISRDAFCIYKAH
jgi:hypothetical protein